MMTSTSTGRFASRLFSLLAIALFFASGQNGSARETDGLAEAEPDSVAGMQTSQGASDEEEIRKYRLTIQKVRTWAEATRKLAQYAEEHPELEDAVAEDPEDEDVSLAGLEAELNKYPEARKIVETSGLKTREFFVLTFVMAQLWIMLAAEEMGLNPDTIAAEAEINPAHIAFLREHKEELERLWAEAQAQEGEPGEEEPDEEEER